MNGLNNQRLLRQALGGDGAVLPVQMDLSVRYNPSLESKNTIMPGLLVLVLIPMLFLSGASTPPESMAPGMRYATLISPMRYYINFGYQLLFKGNGLAYVWHDILSMLVLGGLMFGFSVARFRRLLGWAHQRLPSRPQPTRSAGCGRALSWPR